MKSSKSSPKRTSRSSSEEISGFHLFYQLTYMSATAAAGISRSKIFDLARRVASPPAKFFSHVSDLAEKMRFNYPDACRMVGERIKAEHMRTFLLRFSDALRSGEPLPPFLAREASVQGEVYSNEYERQIESLKKWDDAYVSMVVSAALIVIINMVSTMIYNIGVVMMIGMVFTSIVMGFIVAWVLSRAAPQELLSLPWGQGSAEQRRALKFVRVFIPLTGLVSFGMAMVGVNPGWVFLAAAATLIAPGVLARKAETAVGKKDAEIAAFYRSLGGTATSRGTTLGQALMRIETASFPALAPDIRRLDLRLRASAKPETCWKLFSGETGSRLIAQTTGVFYEATNLGGDPETAGVLCSLFATKTAMLRAKRGGVAATFSWLTMVMHGVVAALMVFILEILKRFLTLMRSAMPTEQLEGMQSLAGQMLSFSGPQTQLLERIVVAMIILLALINAFAIVASEGTHTLKMTFYVSIMLFISGVGYLVVPKLVTSLL